MNVFGCIFLWKVGVSPPVSVEARIAAVEENTYRLLFVLFYTPRYWERPQYKRFAGRHL